MTPGTCKLCGAGVLFVEFCGKQIVALDPQLVTVVTTDNVTVSGRLPHVQSCARKDETSPSKTPVPL